MHGGSTSADAEAAYIQPLLPDDVHLYVAIPDSLLTDNMRKACLNVSRPVFRLRRPLYGWSRSGDIWEKHLSETLQELYDNYEANLANQLAGKLTQQKQLDGYLLKIGHKHSGNGAKLDMSTF